MDYFYSNFVKGWVCHSNKINTATNSLHKYKVISEPSKINELRGCVMQNLGMLAILFYDDPRYAAREFGITSGKNTSFYPENRVDLVEIKKQRVFKAWEIKSTVNRDTLTSDQIDFFKNTYSNNFKILGNFIQYYSPEIVFLTNLIEESLLDTKISEFMFTSIEALSKSNSSITLLNQILNLTEYTLDNSLLYKHPGLVAYDHMQNLNLDMQEKFDYLSFPKFNSTLFTRSLNPKLIQTTTVPYLEVTNLNSILEISIKSKIHQFEGLNIQVCFSVPKDFIDQTQMILKNRTFVNDEICEYLDNMIAHKSTNLNFWNFLSSLNLSFEELFRSKKLIVEIC